MKDFLKRLIDHQEPDETLIKEESEKIVIGPKKRVIYVSCFSWENHRRLSFMLGMFLHSFMDVFYQVEMASKNGTEISEEFATKLEAVIATRRGYRVMMRVFMRCLFREMENRSWRRWTWRRYFRKCVSVEEMLKLFWAIYCYNYVAVKKNVQFLLRKVTSLSTGDTYTYSSAENSGGVIGSSVKPQYQRYDSSSSDTPNSKPKRPI